MDIIIWRHAEAEANSVNGRDADRVLTKGGRKDAARMAEWLKKHLPADSIVVASPALRCQETAAALHNISHLEVKTADFLSVNSNVERIRKELASFSGAKAVLLVGHQPNLGWLVAKLAGLPDSACSVKKCAVWWLRQRMGQDGTVLHTYLLTVQHPDFL